MVILNIVYQPQFRHFPWRIISKNTHINSGINRDDAIDIAIRHMKYSNWGKVARIKVYNREEQLEFIITKVKH